MRWVGAEMWHKIVGVMMTVMVFEEESKRARETMMERRMEIFYILSNYARRIISSKSKGKDSFEYAWLSVRRSI